jgi:hypothetical protein
MHAYIHTHTKFNTPPKEERKIPKHTLGQLASYCVTTNTYMNAFIYQHTSKGRTTNPKALAWAVASTNAYMNAYTY